MLTHKYRRTYTQEKVLGRNGHNRRLVLSCCVGVGEEGRKEFGNKVCGGIFGLFLGNHLVMFV